MTNQTPPRPAERIEVARIEFDCPYADCIWPDCRNTHQGYIAHPLCASEEERARRELLRSVQFVGRKRNA